MRGPGWCKFHDSHGHREFSKTTIHLLPKGSEHAWAVMSGTPHEHPETSMGARHVPGAPTCGPCGPARVPIGRTLQGPETSLALPACRIALSMLSSASADFTDPTQELAGAQCQSAARATCA